MALSYFPWFDVQFTDANGLPLSSGKVYSYYDGTSTPAPTYNQNGVVNANPIILDASGRCDMRGDDTITYKIVVYSSANVLIKTYTEVALPSGNGGAGTVTMDTIAQGVNYKKMTTSNVNSLTTGGNTTLHYHSADRQWANITGKPSTFTPSAHAASHISGGSDPLSHNSLSGIQTAQAGVTYGHINAGTQTIYGAKTFNDNVQTGFLRSSSVNGDTQINGPSIISATSSFISSVNTNVSDATTTVTLSNAGNTTTLNSVSDGESLVKCHTITNDIELRATNDTTSSISCWDVEGRRATLLTWGDSQYSSLQLQGLTSNFNVLVKDDADIYTEISTPGLYRQYRFPETVNGNYNIATREWVNSLSFNGYNYTQGYPQNIWTITHNLGYKPVVQTWNTADDVITGDIHHVSVNELTVHFTSGQAGGARCI